MGDRFSVLVFAFCVKHLTLDSWSLLLDASEETLVSPTGNFSYVFDIFAELGCSPEHLISSQVPLLPVTTAVQFFTSGLPFQNTDLDASIIAPLFAEFYLNLGIFSPLMPRRQPLSLR